MKGELVIGQASGMKSYFELKKFIAENEKYLNAGQKERVEAICSKMYEVRKGQVAADFTYPDSLGNRCLFQILKGKWCWWMYGQPGVVHAGVNCLI